MLYKKIGLTLCLLALIGSVFSQNSLRKIDIEGKVKDASTGESLPGVIVYIVETGVGTVTDNEGNYKMSISGGKYTFRVSMVGYDLQQKVVDLNKSQKLDIRLFPNTLLEEVVITSKDKNENVTRINMGVEKLDMKQIKKMPALLGEVDVIKAIQLLPGVQATSEGGSGFSVRGGSPDQNLILIDKTTVYNASHLLGFFSVFNNDVVNDIELFKGDLPLKYGGRLSSLLDVNTLEDMPKQFTGTGGIGLISSRLMLQGPIGEKTSWLVGGRRSYADLFLKLSSDEALRKSVIYFYDLNGKMTHRFSSNDRLDLNVYYGYDKFGAEPGQFYYGNTAASLTWSHVFTEKLFSKFSFNLTDYKYGLASDLENSEVDWKSNIFDLMFRADFNQPINDLLNLNYGLSSTYHKFNPGLITQPGYPDYSIQDSRALEHGLYISNEQKLTEQLSLKYGLRWSIFQNIGASTVYGYDADYEVVDSTKYGSGDIYHTYSALEPRIGLVYKLTPYSSVKANYAHNTQFIQLANNSSSGSPLDVWFPASPNVKPQQVDMFSVGYFHNLNDDMFETSVELYYKDFNNVIDFADHAELLLNKYLEGEIRTGTGKAYGIEFMVRKNTGKLTGFVNYTLSRSERTIPEINNGKSYLAPYDKTHAVNLVLSYEFSKKCNFSATWVFATGNPTTYPTGRFEIDGEYFPIYSGRNEYRKPNYDRLDLSLTYIPNPNSTKRWKGEWNFSIYNVYNRKNPWIISYKQDTPTGIPEAEMTYLFGIVPSVTYNFKF